MKRIISALLLAFLLPCSAFAQNVVIKRIADENIVPLNGVLLEKGEEIPVDGSRSVGFYSRMSFEDYICQYILESDTLPATISGLDQFNIKKDEFADIYYDVALKHPELLLVTAYYSLDYDRNTLVVESFKPRFNVADKAEADVAREIISAGIKEYTLLADGYDTDLEKLLVIHDKMVADCDYDVRVLDDATSGDVPICVHHAVGVFRDKKAVCQGYAQALYAIAKELGIEMDFCVSDEKNHMWNYVKLDGKWYHMDMTNDDPAERDTNGTIVARSDTRAYHRYFMVSDSGLNSNAHGSDARTLSGNVYSCSDNKYETDHIFNINTAFTAQKGEDGFYHVPITLNFASENTEETVDFKSATLYTGAAVAEFCPVKSTTGRNLYFIIYSTRALEDAFAYFRYDSINQFQQTSVFDLDSDTIGLVSVASNVPENMTIEFSAFLWKADTLVPYSVNTKWGQE